MRSRTGGPVARALVTLGILCFMAAGVCAAPAVTLRGDGWSAEIEPDTLKVCARLDGEQPFCLSEGQAGLGPAAGVVQSGASVRWSLPNGISVSMQAQASGLAVRIRSGRAARFTWPVIAPGSPARALIWPRGEGCYIPLEDTRWTKHLVDSGDWDTLASLSMPFWALDCGRFTVTWILTNPCNNLIRFAGEDRLTASLTHEFTPHDPEKSFGLLISLSRDSSPVEPARRFRKFLIRRGEFVPMRQKLKSVPGAARLLGAPDVYLWGDGVSPEMLRKLQEAGITRARLCVDGWSRAEMIPEVAAEAARSGFLFGIYDSFHSIHDPALRTSEDSWDTAQFDEKLFETGPIVGRDGHKLRGFKGKGYLLSPLAARPYVERRVARNFKAAPFTYYFVDCDASGEVFDDYSRLHPATQAQDIAARVSRLRWIGNTYRAVVGSEGGSAYAVPAVHVVEGVFAPDLAWRDRDMTNPESPYFVGRYYPPEAPRIFFRPVPLKEELAHLFYDPRFRLPLYETVFHDSVVSGHHWSSGSLKYRNVAGVNALTEILYLVPPMYHLNLNELKARKEAIAAHCGFFSPVHREAGFAKMTGFQWLTDDRMVQRSVFAGELEITANFRDSVYHESSATVPPQSVMVRWLKSGRTQVYTPRWADLPGGDSLP